MTDRFGESEDELAARSVGPGSPTSPIRIDFEQFRRAVFDLGLIDDDEWELFAAFGQLRNVVRLSRALVQAGKLTPYQAAAICQGKSRGLVVGEYLVLDKLGQGGMGVVFKARRRSAGRDVALKILPPSFGRDQEAVRRFRREFEVASRIDHPNIVSVLDADEDRGVQFLTMVHIDGRDLDRLVRETGPLPIELGLDCAIQAARGLAAAHGSGIVHRDVKPGNLMLDGSGTVRVLDLGLARVIEAASHLGRTAEENLTQTGTYLGTVDFLAPEQADDSKRADHRADVYSLGCTLYFLLTGKPPFGGATVLKRLMAHQSTPAPSLRAARADAPEALDEACREMMAKRPDDRPASMAEVVEILEACRRSSDEVEAARSGLRGFAETFMKRASPRRRDRDGEGSIFATRREPQGLQFDPDLRLEDLVMDFRDVVPVKPLAEEKLPPRPPRIVATSRKPRKPRPTVLVLLGIAVIAAGAALFTVRRSRRVRPKIESPSPVAAQAPDRLQRPEVPTDPPPPEPGAFKMINGRPTLAAPFRKGPFAVDGVIQPGEYGPPVEVDFTPDSRYGAVGYERVLSRTVDDLSVRIHAAYSDRALFIAYEVRDQFVDWRNADPRKPYLNDGVELYLDGDRVANDFDHYRNKSLAGSREGFELVVSAAGHRSTLGHGLNNDDWKAQAGRTNDGYVIEYEVPLAVIDVRDGPDHESAYPGSFLHFGTAIHDNDETSTGRRQATAFLRARRDVVSPYFGGEKSWSMGVLLEPKEKPPSLETGRFQTALAAAAASQWGPAVQELDACPVESRGWEWGFLRGLCDRRILPDDPRASRTQRFPARFIGTLAFSPDGGLIAAGGVDRTVRIWEPATGKIQSISIQGDGLYINGVTFSPDGKDVAAATTDGLTILSVDSETIVRTHQRNAGSVNAASYSPDGKRIATGGDDQTVRIWESDTGRLARVLQHPGVVGDVRFSRDGELICSACSDSLVRIWNSRDGRLVRTLAGHVASVGALSFNADGTCVASTGADQSIIVWKVPTGEKLFTLKPSAKSLDAPKFSPDGRRLAAVLEDRSIRIWDAASGEELLRISCAVRHNSIEFSPDGNRLAAGGKERPVISIWDAARPGPN